MNELMFVRPYWNLKTFLYKKCCRFLKEIKEIYVLFLRIVF
jgi:hypothetical protein